MSLRILSVLVLLISSLTHLRAADQVVITEFMAANSFTLADEDGGFSDWVEIYNADTNTVNLDGWSLTDNDGNLTKWQFPSTNMAPHTFLVVFASGKNRRVPGAPLHANFSLNAGGEYLALVRPDGVTIASEFAPQFPNQFSDVAFGFVMTGSTATLLPAGAGARALVPGSDIGTAWRGMNYDDSAWTTGTTGAGYDQGTNYLPGLGLNIGAVMSNVNASAYLRVPFEVSDPAQYEALTLRIRYDDGFIAYLNGTEVARRNAPVSPTWNSTATTGHGAPPPAAQVEDFEGSALNYTLNQYGTAPAPSVQLAGAGSTGRFLRLLTDPVNNQFNTVTFRQAAPGLFETITASFDFRGSDAAANPADGFAFMLIPTSVYGTNGPGLTVQPSFGVEEPNYPGVFAVGFDAYPHGTQNDVSVHWNGAELNNVTMPRAILDLISNQFHRVTITLQYVAGGARVTVRFVGDINGVPAAAYTPINNFFVPGLNPYQCRAQIAGRTGGADFSLDLDNLNLQFQPAAGLIAFEDIDLPAGLGVLAAGSNVLAIQGLNLTVADSDFLIEPQLVFANFGLTTNATFIAPATPGAWNNVSGAGTVAPVVFSPPPGVYSSNTLAVTLASASSSAEIRYTIDGTSPTASSLLYSGAITFGSNRVIRARAFAPGQVESEVTAGNYVLLDAGLTNFTSNLPLVIIDSLGGTIVAEVQIPTYVVFINTNGPGNRASMNGPFDYRGRAGVELHGQSSLGFPKQSMNLETDNEKDNDKAVSLLGLPKGSDWVLYAPYTDKTLMNDLLTYELHEAMGHYAVRRKFVEVFVRSTPGRLGTNDYRGVYVLLEKIRIDNDRVDISEPQSGEPGDPITGGYIFKRDKGSPGMVEFTTLNQPYTVAINGVSMQYHDPRGDELNPAQRSWLTNHLNEFETSLYGANWRDPLVGYLKYIAPASFVDQHWIVEFPKNIDGYRLSDYMHLDRGGKIKMEPIWDWNLSWGNANYLEGGLTNGWYHTQLGGGDDIWLSRLRTDPDFYQRIIDRWGELRTDVFALSNLLARVDRITNQLWEAQSRDFGRWPRLSAYVWPNPDGANLVPTGTDGTVATWHVNYATPGTYQNLIAEMKNWIRGRHAWIDARFVIKPALSLPPGSITPGALLSLSAPTGSVYYTLNNTDPRAAGGGVSSAAILYSGPITLQSNAGVMARAFHTNSWSPPASGVYVVSPPTLAITEIMFHPQDVPTNSPYGQEEFEFIEIKNTGLTTLNLQGARLAGGIEFTFQPSVLVPGGLPTTHDFDTVETQFTASTLNSGPGATVTGGGPDGNFLRLVHSGSTSVTRNRVAFSQTASGPYARLTADFDFRATTITPPATNGPASVQTFDAAGAAFTLGGVAAVTPANTGSSGSFLQLVPSAGSLVGTVGFERTATGAWNTVVASFDFRITPPSEANQADGMSFAFLNTANFGVAGAAPGMSEEMNLANTIGIGIDDYNNAEINNNHLSVHWNNAIVGTPYTPPFDFSNGQFHRAQVTIRFSGGAAFVTVRLTPDINGTPGQTVTLVQNLQINGVPPYEGRAAFGARTGGQWASHDIDNLNIQYSTDTGAAAGVSLALLPVNRFGNAGVGSTLAHYTDAPLVTNGLSMDLAFNGSNTANDVTFYYDRVALAAVSLPIGVLDLDEDVFHRASLTVQRASGGSYVTLSLTPNSQVAPGLPNTVVSNLYVLGLLPENARVELAGRNGGLNAALDVESVYVQYYDYASLLLAPGECILVVKNIAAFESRYGTGYRIAGEYSGTLDNSGDHIVLLGPVGEVILDFTYSDDWYHLTDGLGFSLVNANPGGPGAGYGSSTNWRGSSYQGGSPGAFDPVLNLAPILINEILANSILPEVDRIELFNPTTNDVNIGGWFLTDDWNSPKKFRIPNGTVISNGGFIVFHEGVFNPTPGLGSSFALGSDGDEVWLFSGDAATNLTGYVHGFDFGGSDENVSFGRYLDSAGGEHFPAQFVNTFGGPNSGPRLGSVIITEVMYRPPDFGGVDNDLDEFIEIVNIGASPVPLYSPALPTDTWHLRHAVDFDFPMNLELAVGEIILVVGFDPTNTVALADFQARYQVNPLVRVFGPWSGQLDNSGEDVELNRPLAPGTNGTVYVRADQVGYADHAPWAAAADGYGPSLQRTPLVSFGDDPGSWSAATASAGAAFPGGSAPFITAGPASASVIGGRSTNFSVAASGPALRYQWRMEGANLPGATNGTLALSNIQITQAGDYHVAVFNAAGSEVSTHAHLTVLTPVLFILQPTNQNVLNGTNVTLVSAAVGHGPVTYQWRNNGTNIPNATNASHSFSPATLAFGHGNWQVTASDALSSTDSSNAFIFVLVRPGIILQPMPQAVGPGQSALFVCVATGAPPIVFRWLTNGVGSATNTSGVFVFPNVQASLSVRAVVQNVAGSVNSSTVALTVWRDFDGDGIADNWETNYFGFSTNSAADGLLDFDGDGLNNHDEFVAGTNPTNALSVLKLVRNATNASLLQFTAQTNKTYTVVCRTNLTSAWWVGVTNIFPAITVRTIEVNSAFSPALDPERYYHVLTPMNP